MEELFDAYLTLFEKLHQHVAEAIDGLPAEALDWVPGAGMNSLAVLVVHLTASQRYWIGDVAAGEPSGRDRPSEFLVQGLTGDELQQRLSTALDYARQTVGQFTSTDLGLVRVSPIDGRQFLASWALMHALEHAALHVGHIQITRQLWEQQVK